MRLGEVLYFCLYFGCFVGILLLLFYGLTHYDFYTIFVESLVDGERFIIWNKLVVSVTYSIHDNNSRNVGFPPHCYNSWEGIKYVVHLLS